MTNSVVTESRPSAADVFARSETSVSSIRFNLANFHDYFTAEVTLDGELYDYLFRGDWFVGGHSVALGRVRRMVPGKFDSFRATTAAGVVVAEGVERRAAHIALLGR